MLGEQGIYKLNRRLLKNIRSHQLIKQRPEKRGYRILEVNGQCIIS